MTDKRISEVDIFLDKRADERFREIEIKVVFDIYDAIKKIKSEVFISELQSDVFVDDCVLKVRAILDKNKDNILTQLRREELLKIYYRYESDVPSKRKILWIKFKHNLFRLFRMR